MYIYIYMYTHIVCFVCMFGLLVLSVGGDLCLNVGFCMVCCACMFSLIYVF